MMPNDMGEMGRDLPLVMGWDRLGEGDVNLVTWYLLGILRGRGSGEDQDINGSVVPARLGPKAPALARLKGAPAW